MATDLEESDTDDHDRPAPPKRQRTKLLKVNENCWDTDTQLNEKKEIVQDAEPEYDEVERHAREKLKRWQALQVARGFVDNTINKVLENYIMAPPTSHPLEHSKILCRGNDMEDTAVTMAIRNHGLVQSTGIISQSHAFYGDRAPGYWTNNEYSDVQCAWPSNCVQAIESISGSLATTSTNTLRPGCNADSEEMNRYMQIYWDVDRPDDSDQQKNFLERAVAEAIKKKGLSALSVDYD